MKGKVSRIKSKLKTIPALIAGLLIFLFFFLPIYYLVTMSFKSVGQLVAGESGLIFFKPTLNAWKSVLSRDYLWIGLYNSLKASTVSTLIAVAMGTPTAYAFSRYAFRGSKDFEFFILTQRMLPPIAILLPYIVLWKMLGVLGSWCNLIIPYVLISLPISVWLMYAYIDGIPISLEESAMVDGCTQFQAFRKILIPNVLPGLAMTSLFVFALLWNETFFALLFHDKTLPVVVAATPQYAEVTPWPKLSAFGVFLMLIPTSVAYYLQREIRKFSLKM